MFLKKGGTLLPLLFSFASEYAISRVQVNNDDLKLNGTHQLLAYAEDTNILGGSIHTIKKNSERVVASKESGQEVNADKTKYMVMSQVQTTRRSHKTKIDNSSFERVEPFKFWEEP
jgi:hypothetical protein